MTANQGAEPTRRKYAFPNPLGRVILQAFGEVLEPEGLNRVALRAGWEVKLHSPLAQSWQADLPFEKLGALECAIDEVYGIQAGRGLSQRAGRLFWRQGLSTLGNHPKATGELSAVRVLPLSRRIPRGAELLSRWLNHCTEQQVHIDRGNDRLFWIVEQCPHCWGRKTENPCCHMAIGALQEGLAWISGGKRFLVEETDCRARGDPSCTFTLRLKPFA
ncbi:MAG: 4-vinyl reductase [Anaerolineales bacterium]|jgi:predicted hydrocarbon binding protein